MKREPNITGQQAREIVEKMGRRKSYTPKSMDDFYRSIGLEPEELEPKKSQKTEPKEKVRSEADASAIQAAMSDAVPPSRQEVREASDHYGAEASATEVDVPAERAVARRISGKQRRPSLEGYRSTYLQVPKIINRKPVFVSETVRDELDRVVRYLGGKDMSASGLIENLVRLHLDAYRNDIEQWRKL